MRLSIAITVACLTIGCLLITGCGPSEASADSSSAKKFSSVNITFKNTDGSTRSTSLSLKKGYSRDMSFTAGLETGTAKASGKCFVTGVDDSSATVGIKMMLKRPGATVGAINTTFNVTAEKPVSLNMGNGLYITATLR